MNAGDLKKLLEGVPDDMRVVISARETEDAVEAGQTLVWLDSAALGGHTPYWAMMDYNGKPAPKLVFLLSSSPIENLQEMQIHLAAIQDELLKKPGVLSNREYESMMDESQKAGEWMLEQLRSKKPDSGHSQ